MKKIKLGLFTVILMMASTTFLFVSCKKDGDEVTVDKTALQQAIVAANSLISTTTEGTAEGQYLPGSKSAFQAVIDAAEVVAANPTATQNQVDNTVIALAAATAVYNSNIVAAIAPAALMGHWTFDEGSGTTLTDYSGSSFDGTLKDGATTWGGGLPTWTTDRYGNAGGALMFDKGAHVLIPYNTALNPSTMSITVWVKASTVRESNRFIGLHSWLGYKFQLQSANKSFFTINTANAIYDRDTDPTLDTLKWYNLSVTFGGDEMTFYINGTKTKVWNDTPGTALANTGNDLVFGQGTDEYAATADNYDIDKIIPLAWGGYYHGALDEVRIYNTVLSAAQVQSIYELEKAPN